MLSFVGGRFMFLFHGFIQIFFSEFTTNLYHKSPLRKHRMVVNIKNFILRNYVKRYFDQEICSSLMFLDNLAFGLICTTVFKTCG